MSEPDHKPDGSGMDDGPWLPGKGPRAKPDAQAVFPGDAFVGHPLDAKLEDETRNMRGDAAALYSIAISLKRIADVLAGTAAGLCVTETLLGGRRDQ